MRLALELAQSVEDAGSAADMIALAGAGLFAVAAVIVALVRRKR